MGIRGAPPAALTVSASPATPGGSPDRFHVAVALELSADGVSLLEEARRPSIRPDPQA
jgi:hypothetical protein